MDLEKLKKDVETRNFEDYKFDIHSLKGNSAYAGAS